MSASGDWFVRQGGEETAVSAEYIRDGLRTRSIEFDAHVWRKGFQDWVPLYKTVFNGVHDELPPGTDVGPRDDDVIDWVSREPSFDWWIYFGLLIVLAGSFVAVAGIIGSAISAFLLPVVVPLSAAPQAKAIRHYLIVRRHILPAYK